MPLFPSFIKLLIIEFILSLTHIFSKFLTKPINLIIIIHQFRNSAHGNNNDNLHKKCQNSYLTNHKIYDNYFCYQSSSLCLCDIFILYDSFILYYAKISYSKPEIKKDPARKSYRIRPFRYIKLENSIYNC